MVHSQVSSQCRLNLLSYLYINLSINHIRLIFQTDLTKLRLFFFTAVLQWLKNFIFRRSPTKSFLTSLFHGGRGIFDPVLFHPLPLLEKIKGRGIFFSRLFFLLLLVIVIPTYVIEAKTIPEEEVTRPLNVEFKHGLFSIHAKEIPLGEILAEIEKQSGFTISIDESLKTKPVTVSFPNLDITKSMRLIIDAMDLGGYDISYRSTSTSGKIGQWVVDRVVLVEKGSSPEMPDKVGSTLTQKDKNQGKIAKKPKNLEKEPYFENLGKNENV